MHDATIDRLSKIISEPRPDEKPGRDHRLPQARSILSHLRVAEGWFSFFLLALVVYSTIWCVQAANWVSHLGLLTPITALGLILGIIAAKQQRIPRLLAHGLAILLSLLAAFWQTTATDYAGHATAWFASMHAWLLIALNGGTSNDDSVFLFFILVLGFLLAYTSAWLLYRTRSPWLMLLANAVVLLINLSNIDVGYIVFLITFLIASLLLLLRFNLYESSTRWKRQGLRCSDELNWEFMQAGSLISLAILVASWLLPWGYTSAQAAQIWTQDGNPWVQAQNVWNRLLAVNNGVVAQNHGSFANLLTLGGNPNLTHDLVFQVSSTDGNQYLMALSYDQYDGARSWFNSATDSVTNKANIVYYDDSLDLRSVTQTVKVVNPPGEQYAYILGASQIAASDQVSSLVANRSDGEIVSWLRQSGKLAAGDVYKVTSYVSNADIQTLETIPAPADAPILPTHYDGQIPPTYYDLNVLATYTRLPPNLDQRIKRLAQQVTANAKTVYDKVTALQDYLRANYTYDATITAPPGKDEATSWFLFQSKRGFCNYFATAMTLMARELGIPARVAAGYTNGKVDSKTGLWDVSGVDAHAWTQIYFAGYGWINFEPSASFSTFSRPATPANGTTSNTINPTGSSTNNPRRLTNRLPQDANTSQIIGSTPNSSANLAIRQDVGVVLIALVLFILGGLIYLGLWWRRLFRGLSLPSQVYGRVSVLAAWAGITRKRSQTPHEYMQTLSIVDPGEGIIFERLGDIYTRERWADPASADHPAARGEIKEMPELWRSLRPRLIRYALSHPHVLRTIPGKLGSRLRAVFARRTYTKTSSLIVEEDYK